MYWCGQQSSSTVSLWITPKRRSSASRLIAQVYYTLVDCNPQTLLLQFILDLSYKLFLHRYAAVGMIFFSNTSRRAIFTFCGSRASCYACYSWPSFDLPQAALQYVMYFQLSGQRHTCTRWPRIGDAKKAYTKNDSPWATLDRGGVDVYDCLILVLYHLQ